MYTVLLTISSICTMFFIGNNGCYEHSKKHSFALFLYLTLTACVIGIPFGQWVTFFYVFGFFVFAVYKRQFKLLNIFGILYGYYGNSGRLPVPGRYPFHFPYICFRHDSSPVSFVPDLLSSIHISGNPFFSYAVVSRHQTAEFLLKLSCACLFAEPFFMLCNTGPEHSIWRLCELPSGNDTLLYPSVWMLFFVQQFTLLFDLSRYKKRGAVTAAAA